MPSPMTRQCLSQEGPFPFFPELIGIVTFSVPQKYDLPEPVILNPGCTVELPEDIAKCWCQGPLGHEFQGPRKWGGSRHLQAMLTHSWAESPIHAGECGLCVVQLEPLQGAG